MKNLEKINKVHFNSFTGKWTVLREDGAVMCHGTKTKIEDFLDWKQNTDSEAERIRQVRIRQARIRRRIRNLLNWLYNKKKGR